MREKMDLMMIRGYYFMKNKARQAKEVFVDETGAVDMVAIVVMIVIVLALAVIFRKLILDVLKSLGGKMGALIDKSDDTTGTININGNTGN